MFLTTKATTRGSFFELQIHHSAKSIETIPAKIPAPYSFLNMFSIYKLKINKFINNKNLFIKNLDLLANAEK